MGNKLESLKAAILAQAQELNITGKRTRDSKLQVAETVTKALELGNLAASEVLDFIESNLAQAVAKPKTSNKKPSDYIERGKSHTTISDEFLGTGCFIVTSAQNNTAVEQSFLSALELYAQELDACLLISGYTYNKQGFQLDRDINKNYDRMIRQYLVNKPLRLFNGLVFAAELDILPTATRPTNGHNGYHGDNSLIVPHSKIELQSLPTALTDCPKFVWSTGTVTVPNYRQQRAGQRAEGTHCLSALIVQRADNSLGYSVRQLHWDGESFIDLGAQVMPDSMTTAPQATAITLGDIHAEKLDHTALMEGLQLANLVRAKSMFLHDLFDFTSRNHHNIADHHFIAAQGQRKIADDLNDCSTVLNTICSHVPDSEVFVVRSNHDEALDRWLKDRSYDYRNDPLNARLYLDLQSESHRYIENSKPVPDLLPIALTVTGLSIPKNVEFLTRKDSVVMQGVILSQHGDSGVNGSRGTPQQNAKTYSKMTQGHTHACSIYDGNYCVGVTGLLDMGYNTAKGGGSSWSHSHVIQYANGERAVIIF